MVPGPQRISSTLLAFLFGQATNVNVSARKDADLILDAGKNTEAKCARGTPGSTRKGPSHEDFASKIVVFSVDVSGEHGACLTQDD